MGSLDKYIHPFVPSYHKWARWANPRSSFSSRDEIHGVSFGTGYGVAVKQEIMEVPHVHEATDEYFIFTGAELDNVFDSEFEIDFFMGDDANGMELFTITKPTVVRVPPFVWHCPIFYKKVYNGANTMILYTGSTWGKVLSRFDENGKEELYYWRGISEGDVQQMCVKDASKVCTFCGQCFSENAQKRIDEGFTLEKSLEQHYKNAKPRSGKYDKYVYELPKIHHNLGDAVMNPRIFFGGDSMVDMAAHQFSFNIVTKPVKLGDDEPVSNGQVAEFLYFTGVDLSNEFGCFDAEIEVWLGEVPQNMQKLVIDKPSVVTVPPGIWRGAIDVKRVGKPLNFMPFYPYDKPRYRINQKTVNGETLLIYNDESTIKNPTKGDELFMNLKNSN